MEKQLLHYTAITASHAVFETHFPLHPQTVSDHNIGELLTTILDAVSEALNEHGNVSDGDLLQALAMATAIRARMIPVNPTVIDELVNSFLYTALAAVRDAPLRPSGVA